MENFLENLKAFFSRLSMQQRLGIGLVVGVALICLVSIGYWAQQTEYSLLFGNLSESSASQVVETLAAENIDYQLKEGGTTIYVPSDKVYDLRLRFAGEGMVSDGSSGYEIFDQNTLGMTDFMQKLNLRRALEGELARTISNITQVDAARVHLVIPERSPFRETQTEASASVVLDLNSGSRLSLGHIEGMIALVSGAVEGLGPADVNILDTDGNMLSDPDAGDSDARLTSNQLRLQAEKEGHLAEKAQSLLDQMLGSGNSVIRVNLELDFSRSIKESNTIDPESQTVIAEERLQEEGDADNASSSVRNYEVSRSVQTVEKSVGDISYLSVSVILDYKEDPDAAAEAGTSYIPYPEEEVTKIENLVKESVGWRADRGDGFAISQLMFDTSTEDVMTAQFATQQRREQTEMFIRYGLMILALGLAGWLIKSAMQKAKETVAQPPAGSPRMIEGRLQVNESGELTSNAPQLIAGPNGTMIPAPQGQEGEDLILLDDFYTSKLSPEAKAKLKAKQKMLEEMKQSIMADPQEAADLIRSWLAADDIEEPEEEETEAAL
ncbi:MAG: flagellar basal-body MS-ring/collar protein FliF [Bacteroidota bacterium]